jgi:tetratricopeptide (TPR) repeat protein
MKTIKIYKIITISLCLFLFMSCGPKNAFNNWEEILKRGRFGLSIVKDDGRPLYSYSMNKKLEKFIIENKDYLYKKDPKQYYYDRAVIDLMTNEYVNSFEFFRDYLRAGGSVIKADLQLHGMLTGENNSIPHKISEKLFWIILENPEIKISNYEAAVLISIMGDKVQIMIPDFFNRYKDAISNIEGLHHMFLDEPPSIEEAMNNYNPDFPFDNDISKRVFPVSFIENIESTDPTLWEIEFIYSYYYETQDYEKAYGIYKKYYLTQIEPDYGRKYRFQSRLLQILYETKKYDELLEIYEWGKDNEDLVVKESTYVSGYYWVACAYAQIDDFENSKTYLQKALDISSIQKDRDSSTPFMQPNTFVLVWEITMNEVFDKFREDGRYEEIKEMMNVKLSTLEDYFFHGAVNP